MLPHPGDIGPENSARMTMNVSRPTLLVWRATAKLTQLSGANTQFIEILEKCKTGGDQRGVNILGELIDHIAQAKPRRQIGTWPVKSGW